MVPPCLACTPSTLSRCGMPGPPCLQEKGLLRLEGKEYVVQEGDIMLFRFNV